MFYATCMDSTAIEVADARPIAPLLAGIDSVTSAAAVVARIASLQVRGIDVAFRYSPDVDPHDAAHYVTWLSQGGLGLPDRDYYTNTGPAADSLRSQYVDHLARLFTLAGQPATAGAGRRAPGLRGDPGPAKPPPPRRAAPDPRRPRPPVPPRRAAPPGAGGGRAPLLPRQGAARPGPPPQRRRA